MSKFTLVDFAVCARREVNYRRRVYRRLVDNGEMDQSEADREIELMRAIADYFEQLSNPHLPGTECL